MKKLCIILLFCFLTAAMPARAAACTTWYVSPDGSDQGDGTETAPFQTLAKAVRMMEPGDICYLREGTYRETLKPKSNTSFLAYPGEHPVISACEPLTDWTSLGNSLYAASMDWTLADQNMILADGAFAYEARWPDNAGSLLYPTMSSITKTDPSDRTVFSDNALPEGMDPTGASMWLCGGKRWIFWNRTVTGYNPSTKTITFSSPFSAAPNSAYDPTVENPYVLMGKREFLSCQNEWYYEPKEQKLIFWSSKTPSSMTIEAKKRTETLDLSGVTNVTIEGLTLVGGRIITDTNTSYCVLRSLTSTYAAHSFSRSVHGHQISGHHNLIENSEFAYASYTMLYDTGFYNRYLNNYIHDVNYNSAFIGSVNLAGSKTLFSHNTVRDGGRELLTLHNGKASLIQYNNLYHSSTLTWDTAAVYVNMTDGDNTVIRYNTIHDTISSHLGMGIYFDPCVQNFIVYGNVIWNMTDSAIRLNNPANYILVYHNSAYQTGPLSTVCSGDRVNGDLYGSRYINNIFDGANLKNFPDNTVFQYNILAEMSFFPAKLNYQMEADPLKGTVCKSVSFLSPQEGDLRLQEGSFALTSGTAVPGVSDGNYIGAYPPGAALLNTGHNFSKRYQENYEFPNVIYMNRVQNGGFGYGDLRYWNTEGDNVSIKKDSSWNNANAYTRAGNYSVCLGSGVNAVTQKITGLSKNTVYTLSGWARVGTGSTVTMGVRECSGETEFNTDTWTRKYLTFNTGNRTEITVYYQSSGSGVSYCGDMGLSQPTLMTQEEAKNAAQATRDEDLRPLILSDHARYRQLTVENITFTDDTAFVSVLNNTGIILGAEIQVITYRMKGNTKEYLSLHRIPIEVTAGTVSQPYCASLPVSISKNTAPGEYRVQVRVTDGSLLTPLGQTAETSYLVE